MLDSANAVTALIAGIVVILGAVGGWWYKRGRPKVRQVEAMSEAILGRAEVRDRSGAVIQKAQPGMPAQVAELTEAVRDLVKMQHRVDIVEDDVRDLQGRVTVLEEARLEHVVSRVESAEAYRAIQAAQRAASPDDQPDL